MSGQCSSGPAETLARHGGHDGVKPLRGLACFKAVPELESMTGSDWPPDQSFRVETRFVKTVINPLDESALELSLKLRDQGLKSGQDIELTALTIGDGQADSILKTLVALKFNRTARIESAADLRFNPEFVTAQLLDFMAGDEPFDIILMGGRSADGDNARTPLLLAEALARPCLTQVTGCSLQGENLEVTCLGDGGERTLLVRPPLVLAVGNAPAACLRVPTLKDRMSGKKERELFHARVGKVLPPYELRSLQYEPHERAAVIVEGASPAEKAARLYHDYLKGRL